MTTDIDLVLIMHRDEVFKPTNTGRLIADVFPINTYAFEWSRTQPPNDLLHLLKEPTRYPVVVFPPPENYAGTVYREVPAHVDKRRLTLILLDGTWKQARKMFKSSTWLHSLPLLVLSNPQQALYSVRQAAAEGYLATAEVTAALLKECGKAEAAVRLADYFAVFNQHYVATRMNSALHQSEHHLRLQHVVQKLANSPGCEASGNGEALQR